jgi:hypothetical protein
MDVGVRGRISQHELLEEDVEEPPVLVDHRTVHSLVLIEVVVAGEGFVIGVDVADVVVAGTQPPAQLVGPVPVTPRIVLSTR